MREKKKSKHFGRFSPSDKDKDGKPIDTANMKYQESLKAYQD